MLISGESSEFPIRLHVTVSNLPPLYLKCQINIFFCANIETQTQFYLLFNHILVFATRAQVSMYNFSDSYACLGCIPVNSSEVFFDY